MNPNIALVTANFGKIDPIHPLPNHDREALSSFYYTGQDYWTDEGSATWGAVICPSYPRWDFGLRLRAKYFKLQVHRLAEVRDCRWLVWADSSLAFKSLDFIAEWAKGLAYNLDDYSHALFVPHPHRVTVLDEYHFITERIRDGDAYLTERYGEENMLDQMIQIEHAGALKSKLWCGGFWMVENTSIYHAFLNDWWDQCLRFSIMDQLPIDYLLAKHGITPAILDVNIYENKYFTWARRVNS